MFSAFFLALSFDPPGVWLRRLVFQPQPRGARISSAPCLLPRMLNGMLVRTGYFVVVVCKKFAKNEKASRHRFEGIGCVFYPIWGCFLSLY